MIDASKPIQFCGFKIGNDHFAVDVLSVQEVIKPQKVTPVPKSQDFIKGLINLRGQIVSVISLSERLGLKVNPCDDYMNIIIKDKDSLMAFEVDSIQDTFEVQQDHLDNVPATLPAPLKDFVENVCEVNDQLTMILDLERITNF